MVLESFHLDRYFQITYKIEKNTSVLMFYHFYRTWQNRDQRTVPNFSDNGTGKSWPYDVTENFQAPIRNQRTTFYPIPGSNPSSVRSSENLEFCMYPSSVCILTRSIVLARARITVFIQGKCLFKHWTFLIKHWPWINISSDSQYWTQPELKTFQTF